MITAVEMQKKCERCGHTWLARTLARPGVCPRCKSYEWDVPKKEKK